jgi:hypothetical protein
MPDLPEADASVRDGKHRSQKPSRLVQAVQSGSRFEYFAGA